MKLIKRGNVVEYADVAPIFDVDENSLPVWGQTGSKIRLERE